jgi:hypothetical protein
MTGLPIYYLLIKELPKLSDRWDDIHVMLQGSKCECSVDCFCEPEFTHDDEETGRRIFTHKSFEQLNN